MLGLLSSPYKHDCQLNAGICELNVFIIVRPYLFLGLSGFHVCIVHLYKHFLRLICNGHPGDLNIDILS